MLGKRETPPPPPPPLRTTEPTPVLDAVVTVSLVAITLGMIAVIIAKMCGAW